jgi:hypothetical protein
VRNFFVHQRLWDDSCDAAPALKDGLSEEPHESNGGATINEFNIAGGE